MTGTPSPADVEQALAAEATHRSADTYGCFLCDDSPKKNIERIVVLASAVRALKVELRDSEAGWDALAVQQRLRAERAEADLDTLKIEADELIMAWHKRCDKAESALAAAQDATKDADLRASKLTTRGQELHATIMGLRAELAAIAEEGTAELNAAVELRHQLAAARVELAAHPVIVAQLRAALGEMDVRLAGVEAERDAARVSLANVQDHLNAVMAMGQEAVLKRELAALKARTCQTCRHQRRSRNGPRWCDLWFNGIEEPIYCEDIGFTCGAWAAREQP
jgi:chromosome segregation ATPase